VKAFRWVLVAVVALGGMLLFAAGAAMGQGDDKVSLTQIETLQVEKHLLAVENAKLRLELLEAEGTRLLSQLYVSHGLSQKTHDFVGLQGFVKKPEQIVTTKQQATPAVQREAQ
jgi:hypothetical protein